MAQAVFGIDADAARSHPLIAGGINAMGLNAAGVRCIVCGLHGLNAARYLLLRGGWPAVTRASVRLAGVTRYRSAGLT
jgi:hypothetical protein